jgi:hypothetical protein
VGKDKKYERNKRRGRGYCFINKKPKGVKRTMTGRRNKGDEKGGEEVLIPEE